MDGIRVDIWLWQARFYRTRPLAQRACTSGLIRRNGQRVEKPAVILHCGDILTLPVGGEVAAIRVLDLGQRRGPASEARGLYEILVETVLDPSAAAP
jgi:ribosome-associated heat shock protein Hsp15